jgi:hypothetical protein
MRSVLPTITKSRTRGVRATNSSAAKTGRQRLRRRGPRTGHTRGGALAPLPPGSWRR